MPPQCRISPEPEGAEDLGKHADPALNSKLDSVEQALWRWREKLVSARVSSVLSVLPFTNEW